MKTITLLTFVLLGAPTISNAQVSPEVAAALADVEAPTLTRNLRARAEVQAAVERLFAHLSAPAAATAQPPLLAQNETGRRTR